MTGSEFFAADKQYYNPDDSVSGQLPTLIKLSFTNIHNFTKILYKYYMIFL